MQYTFSDTQWLKLQSLGPNMFPIFLSVYLSKVTLDLSNLGFSTFLIFHGKIQVLWFSQTLDLLKLYLPWILRYRDSPVFRRCNSSNLSDIALDRHSLLLDSWFVVNLIWFKYMVSKLHIGQERSRALAKFGIYWPRTNQIWSTTNHDMNISYLLSL